MSAAQKAKFEREVFEEFVRASGLPVDPKTIQQFEPPAPDIQCEIEGRKAFFELTMLSDSELEHQVGKGEFKYTNFHVGFEKLLEIIDYKSSRKYVATSLDLVIHSGQVVGFHRLWEMDPFGQLMSEVMGRTNFDRIWLFDVISGRCECYEK
jgi:hypothetical protein